MPRAQAEATAMKPERVRIRSARKFPGQLSGGQQQRVAVARSFCACKPPCCLTSPDAALDPEMVKGSVDVMVMPAQERHDDDLRDRNGLRAQVVNRVIP